MVYISGFIAAQVVLLAGYLLYKKYNASITLLSMGALLYLLSFCLGLSGHMVTQSSGFVFLDFFVLIKESFTSRLVSTGFLIMLIGGYVEYMQKIRANDALIYVAMQPLAIFKKYPYAAVMIVMVIGQFLFLSIPSAVGLGLLLITTVYPVLIGLGVSKLTALSAISACTLFDMGPTSANSLLASNISGINNITYFISQLRIVLPTTLLMVLLFYRINKHYDKKDTASVTPPKKVDIADLRTHAPLSYALLPVLPLVFALIFSTDLNPYIHLDTSTAIILSFCIAALFELVRKKSVKSVFASMGFFWHGMGKIFTTVIVLIVAADIFARGLVSLGLIDALIQLAQALGLGIIGITLLVTVIAFFASVLTGSGVATFSTFGNLVPGIAAQLSVSTLDIIIPVQLAAGIGRAASPIAVVIIVLAEIAGESPFALAKRNFLPALIITLFLLFLSFT